MRPRSPSVPKPFTGLREVGAGHEVFEKLWRNEVFRRILRKEALGGEDYGKLRSVFKRLYMYGRALELRGPLGHVALFDAHSPAVGTALAAVLAEGSEYAKRKGFVEYIVKFNNIDPDYVSAVKGAFSKLGLKLRDGYRCGGGAEVRGDVSAAILAAQALPRVHLGGAEQSAASVSEERVHGGRRCRRRTGVLLQRRPSATADRAGATVEVQDRQYDRKGWSNEGREAGVQAEHQELLHRKVREGNRVRQRGVAKKAKRTCSAQEDSETPKD